MVERPKEEIKNGQYGDIDSIETQDKRYRATTNKTKKGEYRKLKRRGTRNRSETRYSLRVSSSCFMFLRIHILCYRYS